MNDIFELVERAIAEFADATVGLDFERAELAARAAIALSIIRPEEAGRAA